MEKKTIVDTIFRESKRAKFNELYTWGEVKAMLAKKNIELQDDDVLEISFQEGWDHGDSAADSSYDVNVYRTRLETDEEFEKRKTSVEVMKERSKKQRYETYLKYKEEFENQ